MVLSMVSIGGVGNISGAVLGTLSLLGLDRLAIPKFQELLESQQLSGFSFRELSFLLFGLALYLSVLTSRQLKSKRTVQ
jgi:ABC-type branched-subunit amino acid transport system permease subunit